MRLFFSGLVLVAAFMSPTVNAANEVFAEEDAKAIAVIKSLDWSKPFVVEMDLQDHHFEPDEVVLPLGKPVVLRLKNTGKVNHDMVGGSFFQAVLVRNISNSAGRVYASYVRAVDVRAKNEAEIWLVPVTAGKFTFYCSIEGHREEGMEGTFTIK